MTKPGSSLVYTYRSWKARRHELQRSSGGEAAQRFVAQISDKRPIQSTAVRVAKAIVV